jgi:hypothetical protein
VARVCLAIVGICAGVAVATVAARALGVGTLVPGVVGIVAGGLGCAALGQRRLAACLPAELDGWFAGRRLLALAWAAAAVLAVANTARVGVFIADPSQTWASAFPPVSTSVHHQCLAAYVRAGELAARGQAQLWDRDDYVGPDEGPPPRAGASTEVEGLAAYLEDPFEYPPTFAVAPRAALAVTGDYQRIRAAWFGISAVGFWLAFVALAIWIGGRGGGGALLLAPIVALSMPVMFCLQFGQAHLLVVAAAVLAMLQFARGRPLSGGVLLALATATKIFPGLLLVYLAVRRQWRAVAATLVAIAALTGIAAVVLGPATLAVFVTDHLPRVASGEAFAFAETNMDNHAPYGLAFKLAALGVPGAGRGLAQILAWAWGVVAVILAVLGARARGDRRHDAIVWLGIVCLGTLRSPFAPMYSAVGTLWLLAVAAVAVAPARARTAAIAIAWCLLQGTPPVPSRELAALASLPAQAASIAIAVLAVWPRRRRAVELGDPAAAR